MRDYFSKNYAKKYRIVSLLFSLGCFVALLLEVFVANSFDLIDAIMLLALAVGFFVGVNYPDYYEEGEFFMPFNDQLLIFLCNFAFFSALAIKLLK